MERIKVLEGKKISLVIPEKQDIELWYKGVNDIETQSYLGSMYGNIIFKEDEEEYYDIIRKDKTNRVFSIYINKEEKNIGNINLFKLDFFNRKAELGIAIFDKQARNKGYGTEAIKLMLKFGFEVLGLNKINLRFIEFNKRAQKVYEKVGFKKCGRLKQESFRNGRFYDDIYMEIFARDFLKNLNY